MKTIGFLWVTCLISFSVISGNGGSAADEHGNKYCAKMKNGKWMMMHEDEEMRADVTLNNGTMIKADGTVIKKDGTRMMLKEGQCVDRDGNMVDMDRDMEKRDKDMSK